MSGEALTLNMGKGEQTDDEIVRVWFAKSLNWLPVALNKEEAHEVMGNFSKQLGYAGVDM